MITQEDVDAFSIVNVTPMEYSYWVEGKIMTGGESRLFENVLGLLGEAGEIAEKAKKLIRDNSKLAEVLETNMDKLNDREARGVLSGNGDNR